MRGEAFRLGKLIVEKEAKLNDLFGNEKADQTKIRKSIKEIARLQGELRIVHLTAHLEIKRVLSADQVKKYDGYADTQ